MLEIITDTITNPAIRFAPAYLASFILISFFIYLLRRKSDQLGSFLGWLFPKSIYWKRSNLTDGQLFLVGRVLSILGLFRALGLRTLITVLVVGLISTLTGMTTREASWPAGETIAVTVFYFLVADLAVYWAHRMHHEMPVLWPFHAVHHSAEVLTPLTVYRKHPVYSVIAGLISDFLVGIALAAVILLLTNKIDMITLAGIHAGYYLFNLLGANFRHSHIWLSYGRWLEHILISPAQHQIHHSRAVEHHDKNYGEVFALWDWMFGTLFVPEKREVLEFGLAERDGTPIEQPHPTLIAALCIPFRQSWASLRTRKQTPAGPAQGHRVTEP